MNVAISAAVLVGILVAQQQVPIGRPHYAGTVKIAFGRNYHRNSLDNPDRGAVVELHIARFGANRIGNSAAARSTG